MSWHLQHGESHSSDPENNVNVGQVQQQTPFSKHTLSPLYLKFFISAKYVYCDAFHDICVISGAPENKRTKKII